MTTAAPEPPTAPATTEGVCRLCGVGLVETYGGIVAEETGVIFGVARCPRCGLGRTRPVPADLAPYYDRGYYGKRHGATAAACRRRRLGIVRRWTGGGGSARALLDYGCAEGDFLAAARDRGWMVAGVERHPPAATPDGVPIAADVAGVVDRGPFDCVTFWHVLEHLDDPVGVLASVQPHLKPGGVVLAAVPNLDSWQARLTGGAWLHLDLPRHLWHFTPRSLTRTFEAAGFRVEGVAFGEFEYDVIGWAQSLLNRGLGGRNEFFRVLSGRPGSGGLAPRTVIQVGAGGALALLGVGLARVEGWFGHGGTLIVAARPSGPGR